MCHFLLLLISRDVWSVEDCEDMINGLQLRYYLSSYPDSKSQRSRSSNFARDMATVTNSWQTRNYIWSHEVNHKVNDWEKRWAGNYREKETKVDVRRRKYHTGGTSCGETSRTGFLSAGVTGDWEQREQKYTSLWPQPIEMSFVNLKVPRDTHRGVLWSPVAAQQPPYSLCGCHRCLFTRA